MNFVAFSNGILLLGMSVLMAGLAALYPATRELFLLSALLAGLVGGLVALAVSHRVTDLSYARIWVTRPNQAARVSVSRVATPSVNVTPSMT